MLLQLALATALTAANPALGLLETAKEQLARHDDVAARKTIERALPYAADDRLLLGQLYLVLGLAWAEGVYEQRAIEAFTTALKLDKQLTLPAVTSPKIQDWWKRAGGTIAAPEPEPEPQAEPQPPEPKPEPKVEPALEPVEAQPEPKVEPKPEPVPAPAAVTAPAKVTAQPSRLWWATVPAAAAAICLVTTGVTWKLADDRYGELARGTRPLMPEEAQSLYSTGQTFQATAQWTAAVAALFAVATVAVVLLVKDE